jgi:molybdopterin converting factor subunit 1
MIVTVKLFAAAREMIEADAISLELAVDATIAQAKQTLTQLFPQMAGLLSRSVIARNQDYALDTEVIAPGDELAVIPPVSGG